MSSPPLAKVQSVPRQIAWLVLLRLPLFGCVALATPELFGQLSPLLSPPFRWKLSTPLVGPADRPADPCVSIKDPTVVFHDGRWRLFCTIRSQKRTHQIEYLSFTDWKQADRAPRHVLTINNGYFCAPQVFYFRPHRKWYLLHQIADEKNKRLAPAVSTTTDLDDPKSWSTPVPLYQELPADGPGWIDFWIICDNTHARLFFTSLDGKMWRADAKLADFPHGWGLPQVVLQGDIFEASHTYRVRGEPPWYLTIVEAQDQDRRYYKAYSADRLDGDWRPLADSRDRPFASRDNIAPTDGPRWTDNVSHGELLRAGNDELLEIDPNRVTLLFQGVSDQDKQGKPYGQIPWRLGMLELDNPRP